MARTVQHLSEAEAQRWHSTTAASAAVALAVALATFSLLGIGAGSQPRADPASSVETSSSQQTVPGSAATTSVQDRPAAAPRASTKTTTSTSAGDTTIKTESKTTTPAPDTSLVGQTLANPNMPWLIALVLAILAGYLAGAVTQRILLGQYGITVGPVTIPNVTPDLWQKAAETASLLAGPQSPPGPSVSANDGPLIAASRRQTRWQALLSVPAATSRQLPVPSPRSIVLADQRDLIAAINRAAASRAIADAPPNDRLLALVEAGAVNTQTASASRDLLEIGTRVERGDPVDAELAHFLSEQYGVAIQRITSE